MSHTPHTSPQDIEPKKTSQQKESESSYVDLVLSRIEQEGIKPHGRWYFILKNELLWGIGILTVLIGACAVSAALYNLSHTEFELYQVTHDSALSFFYDMMPFVWIFGFLVFIGIGYIQIRHTKKGYEYPLYIIVGGMLLISIALGVMLHSIDIGKKTEEVFGGYIPFHKSGEMIRQDRWINAPKGIVAGEVVLVDAQMFAVEDFRGERWLIGTEFLGPRDMFLVATGTKVRIVTLPLPQATTTLTGCLVMPWDMKEFHNQKTKHIESALEENASAIKQQGKKQAELASQKKTKDGPQSLRQKDITKEDERNATVARNNICKDMHPYQLIEKIRAVQ